MNESEIVCSEHWYSSSGWTYEWVIESFIQYTG